MDIQIAAELHVLKFRSAIGAKSVANAEIKTASGALFIILVNG